MERISDIDLIEIFTEVKDEKVPEILRLLCIYL